MKSFVTLPLFLATVLAQVGHPGYLWGQCRLFPSSLMSKSLIISQVVSQNLATLAQPRVSTRLAYNWDAILHNASPWVRCRLRPRVRRRNEVACAASEKWVVTLLFSIEADNGGRRVLERQRAEKFTSKMPLEHSALELLWMEEVYLAKHNEYQRKALS